MMKIAFISAFLLLFLSAGASAGWQASDSVCVPLAVQTGNQWNVRVASDGANGAITVWQDRRNGATDKLYAQRVDAVGNLLWADGGVQLSPSGGFQYYPQILVDGTGGAFVVWEDNRNGIDYDIYMQHISANGNMLWGKYALPLCTAPGHQYNPRIIPDGLGGVIVTWQDRRNNQYDIYAQRVSDAGIPQWTADGQAVCNAPLDQLDPQLTTDGGGGAIIVWTDYRSTQTYPDIYAQHLNADGSIAWQTDGAAVCLVTNTQLKAQVVSDGASGAIVTWQDRRSGATDQVFGQRLASDGSMAWNPNGVSLCTSPGIQYNQRMVSDNLGGAFVVWQDNRTGSDYDIYAQHIDNAGQLLWGSYATAICSTSGQQYNPDIVLDGQSVLFTWQDKRSGTDFDIYCQSTDFNGTARWKTDGQCAVRSGADQISPAIASDGAQGVICAWTDFQNGNGSSDIFTQRIGANGLIGGGLFRTFVQNDYHAKAFAYRSRTKGIVGLPNAGNMRDLLFTMGALPSGITIGTERAADRRTVGWIKYTRGTTIMNGLPQTGVTRPFDFFGTRHFVNLLSNPTVTRYNNHLVGEMLTLKLNIAASDFGFTTRGLGDLIINDSRNASNPLNQMNIRAAVHRIDSALTYWGNFTNFPYALADSTIRKINEAFGGAVDTISTNPMQFKPAKNALFSSAFLVPPPASTGPTPTPHQMGGLTNLQDTPEEFELLQNYPNPFNPVTDIEFTLASPAIVTLSVYNILGQEMVTLIDRQLMDAGSQLAEFDGSRLASGVYFYRILAQDANNGKIVSSAVRKMQLVR